MTELQQIKPSASGPVPTEQADAGFAGSQERRDIFRKQGYLVLKGALEPARDLKPLADAYTRLTDELVDWLPTRTLLKSLQHCQNSQPGIRPGLSFVLPSTV